MSGAGRLQWRDDGSLRRRGTRQIWITSMHNSETSKYLCRVCGLYQDEPPWSEDGKTPTFNICDCCGVEFGYEDARPETAVEFKEIWLAKGARWFNKTTRPADWGLSVQLERIGIGRH